MLRLKEERSLSDLFADLASELAALTRQEFHLAKIELTENVSRVGKDVATVAVGGVVLYTGLLVFVAMVVVGLALLLGSLLISTFIVSAVLLGTGYWFLNRGLTNLKRHDLAPRETLVSLGVNVNWAKDQFK